MASLAPLTGLTSPVTVAVSLSVPPPTTTSGDAWVVIAGVAFDTIVCSSASLHAPLAPALLSSPL